MGGRRDLAVHARVGSELLAEYQLRTGLITRFIDVRGIPLSELREGTILFLAPSMVAWTSAVGDTFAAVTADLRNGGYRGDLILEVAGTATPLARQQLKRLGWIIMNRDGLR